LTGPQSLQLFLRELKLESLIQKFAPEIPKLFVDRVQWDLSELVQMIRVGVTSVPEFPEAFAEPVRQAAISALNLNCKATLQQKLQSWNEFSAELLCSHFSALLTPEEIASCAKEQFLTFHCEKINECSAEIIEEVVSLMDRCHLERLHETVVTRICKSLLNVGQDTGQIVQSLVSIVSVLRRLDRSGFLIDQVLSRVRLYLKHRADLNQSLLNFLFQTKEHFSFADATVSSSNALHFDELQGEENWQPEPSFVTETVSKVTKNAHPAVLVLVSLSSTEALQDEFQNFLAERLLKCPSDESAQELATLISGLKKRCGFELSVAAEVMFRDVFENRAVSPDFSVTIISNRYWPERMKHSLSHPENISE
jgi:hypothetical protein